MRQSRLLPAILGIPALLLSATPLSAQGVRFSVAPSAEYVWWNEALPLKDGTQLGARVGADFGRLIGVTGWFHRGTNIPVALAGTSLRAGGLPFADQTTDVETFGANIAFKLGVGAIVPFVHGGAGVIRFTPDATERIDQVNYRYGGGIQIDASRNIRATVLLEDSRFRLTPEALSPETPDAPTSDPRASRSNWTASASLGFALGGPRNGETAGADRWSFASIPIEPFVGRLEFDNGSAPRQVVAGVRAGVDFGNYVGLRGVYWQGRSDDLGDRMPIQAYGLEAQFNLNASIGLAPFLITGAHRIDYQAGYQDALGRRPAEETALVLGGGVGLRLTDNFRLNVAARDFIRTSRDFDEVGSVDELSHNWMMSAGLGFNLGRSRSRAADDAGRDRERERDERPMRDGGTRPGTDSTRGRMIMLPVPESGELYVRYGDTSVLRERMLRQDTVAMARTMAGMTPTEIDLLVKLLSARIDSILATRDPAWAAQPVQARPPMDSAAAAIRQQPDSQQRAIRGASAYVAGFDALILGVQLDGGPLLGVRGLRLVPEFAVGLHGDKSLLLAMGGEYRFRTLDLNGTRSVQPHMRLSLGLLAASGDTDSRFGFNFAYGVTFVPRDSAMASTRARLFVEHQGLGFFSHNRLAAGLRWQF